MTNLFSLSLTQIEYLPLLLGLVVSIIFGALWYSPLAFGPFWARLRGFPSGDPLHDQLGRRPDFGDMLPALLQNLVALLFLGIVVQLLMSNLLIYDLWERLLMVSFTWLGLTLMPQILSRSWLGYSWWVVLIEQAHILLVVLLQATLFYFL